MDNKSREQVAKIVEECAEITSQIASKLDLGNLEMALMDAYPMYERATRHGPQISRMLESAKVERDSFYARLYLKCRQDAENRKLKPTETTLKSEILINPDYHSLVTDVILLEEAQAVINRAGSVFREKTFAIRSLVELYKHEYFAIDTSNKAARV